MAIPFTETASDGSGFTLTTSSYFGLGRTVTHRNGKVLSGPLNSQGGSGTATDRNGNKISVDSNGNFTDTLGTTALTVSGAAPNPLTFSYTSPAGTSVSVTMNYRTYTVKTNFGCSGMAEYGPTSVSLVDTIRLPDGSAYTFQYEATPGFPGDVTGRLASVTLPTGGTISYTYTGSNSGIIWSDGSAAGLARATPDGQWTYARSGTAPAWVTTITDPQSNQTVTNFQGIYETQRQIYSGSSSSGTLLQTVIACYKGNTTNCTTTAVGTPITQRRVTIQFPGGLQCLHLYFYNIYGLTTEVDDYDYANPGPGALIEILAGNLALKQLEFADVAAGREVGVKGWAKGFVSACGVRARNVDIDFLPDEGNDALQQRAKLAHLHLGFNPAERLQLPVRYDVHAIVCRRLSDQDRLRFRGTLGSCGVCGHYLFRPIRRGKRGRLSGCRRRRYSRWRRFAGTIACVHDDGN